MIICLFILIYFNIFTYRHNITRKYRVTLKLCKRLHFFVSIISVLYQVLLKDIITKSRKRISFKKSNNQSKVVVSMNLNKSVSEQKLIEKEKQIVKSAFSYLLEIKFQVVSLLISYSTYRRLFMSYDLTLILFLYSKL